MNKVYLKLNKTIVEDIILTSEDVDKGIFTELHEDIVLPDLNAFEPNMYSYGGGTFTARPDHRGVYWSQDGTVHKIDDFAVMPNAEWVSDYSKTTIGHHEEIKIKNDMNWQENDNLFTQWQKAEKLGWTVATKLKKAFDEHTKEVTADWHDLQDLKKELDYD